MTHDIKIGSTIWRFDQNRRVYPKAPQGKLWALGGPIYREHWAPVEITAETARSWITRHGVKVPKKGEHRGYAFSEKEVDDDCWIKSHRYKISDAVNGLRDADTLRKIAEIVGYAP